MVMFVIRVECHKMHTEIYNIIHNVSYNCTDVECDEYTDALMTRTEADSLFD